VVRVTPGPVADRQALDRSRTVARWREEELTRVRAAANEWRAGLAALTVLIVGVLTIKGRESVQAISSGYRVLFGVSLGLSLAVACAASVLALVAANGVPRRRVLSTDPGEVLSADRAEAGRAARALHLAIGGTLLSLALLGLAVAVTWFAPSGGSGGLISVTLRDGTTGCGRPSHIDASQVLLSSNGRTIDVSTAEVTSLTVVDRCPQ
jgi:hypothetical protein